MAGDREPIGGAHGGCGDRGVSSSRWRAWRVRRLKCELGPAEGRGGTRSGCERGPAEGMAGHGGASAARREETEMVGPDEIQKGCAEPKMHREGHGMPIQI